MTPDLPQIERLRDFVRMVTEWTAKFPLKGDGSIEDCAAATEIYCCCEGAEENIYELRQVIDKFGAECEKAGLGKALKIAEFEARMCGNEQAVIAAINAEIRRGEAAVEKAPEAK